MSYEEILETRGRFCVKLVTDDYPDKPYDDGQSPLMQIEDRYDSTRAEHIMTGNYRPTDADAYVEAAVHRWGGPNSSDWPLVEKYLRAFHGVTAIETWHSGYYWYVTYDPAAWRAHVGAPEGSINMSEYKAYVEGDVWGWVVEKQVTWHTEDPGYEDHDDWEHVDSCFGYYGRYGENGSDSYLEDSAREALAYESEPYEHAERDHEIVPELLARWDRDAVERKHAQWHELFGALLSHAHDDPRAPFAVTEPAESSG